MNNNWLEEAIKFGVYPPARSEPIGTTLRRLASTAMISNPIINKPWMKPADWLTGTAYAINTVVASNGGWYVCAIAGTSGATAPSLLTAAGEWDGTPSASAFWYYIGPAIITSNDDDAPTVSASSSAPSNPDDLIFTPVQHPSLFTQLGGVFDAIVTNYANPYAFLSKAATKEYGHGAFGFVTSSRVIAFRQYTNQPSPRIIIDGRYLSFSALGRNATSTWYTITFATKKRRTVIVEGTRDAWIFTGIAINRAEQIWPMPPADVRAVFIGDSLYAGAAQGPHVSGNSVPNRIGKLVGWGDVWNMSRGGTGYINTGGGYYTYKERLAQAVAVSPDVIMFGCPTNDTGSTTAAVKAAVLDTLEEARTLGHKGIIIVPGAWPKNDANAPATETAVMEAVTDFGDNKTFGIPLIATGYAPIITNTWNNSFNTSMVNSTLVISSDGTHPSDYGIPVLSDYLAEGIIRDILPQLA